MKVKTTRNMKILEMRKNRFSYQLIANAFGLNKKTVWEIVDRYTRRKKVK